VNKKLLSHVLVVLVVTGCTQAPKLSAPAPHIETASTSQLIAKPLVQPPVDPTIFVHAQANLRALGYAVGKTPTPTDPTFQHALIAFEHDQGLAEEPVLIPAVLEKLTSLRAELQPASVPARDGVFIYSGSMSHQAVLLATPPGGYNSDATAKFLTPLHPGGQAKMHLSRKGSTPIAITCSVGRLTNSKLPLVAYVLPVDCHGDTPHAPRWLDLFSPRLGLVIQQQTSSGHRDLIAVRPNTVNWPVAARSGLDWALSSALDTAGSAPIEWSSTGVAPHFEIKAWGHLNGEDLGLNEDLANAPCRRFELTESGNKVSYPGIACQTVAGMWMLPSSRTVIARPAGSPARTGVSLRNDDN
jgi:hypothetical protein